MSLIKASRALLLNSDLFQIFLEILFKKANVYRYKTVIECFNVLSNLVSALWEHHKSFPYNLDMDFLIKGIKIALHDEVGMTVSKALWLIYKHYHAFNIEFKRRIIRDCLFEDNFSRFMFHWSKQARRVYMHIIVYKIIGVKEYSFEPEEISGVDKEIYSSARKHITSIWDHRSNPYLKLVILEYKNIDEHAQTWFRGQHGVDEYAKSPEILIEETLDKSERTMDY